MLIRLPEGYSKQGILDALPNDQYSDNLYFKSCERANKRDGSNYMGGDNYRVLIGVHDSAADGGSRTLRGHRQASPCWHVYGHFMENLPDQAEVVVGYGDRKKIRIGRDEIWEDWFVGTTYNGGMYKSEMCDCGHVICTPSRSHL